MSPCGCQSAGCGCNVIAGAGIAVQRIGDSFHVSATAGQVQQSSVDAAVDPATANFVYDGPAGGVITAPPAYEGRTFTVWNIGGDATLAADGLETINGAASESIPAGYSASVMSPADGEWLANVH